MKTLYEVGDFPKVWMDIQPSRPGYYFKMVDFLNSTFFGYEDYNHYIRLSVARQGGENFELYKARRKFQQHLVKYRHFVVPFSVMNNYVKQSETKN